MLGMFVAVCGVWVASVTLNDTPTKPVTEPVGEVTVRALLIRPQSESATPAALEVVLLDDQGRPLESGFDAAALGANAAQTEKTSDPESKDDRSESANADEAGDEGGDEGEKLESELQLSYDFLGEPIPTERLSELRARVRRPLVYYFERPETVSDYSPWGIMHALIAFGADTQVFSGRNQVNAIGWLAWNGKCRGQQLMSLRGAKLDMAVGPGLQGHEGQFLAMLAQSYVPSDFELRIGTVRLTVQDLIEYEQRTCRPRTELTFKLIALSHYLPSDATWQSDDGQDWSIDRLIKEELAQPVIGAACGGTHRLMGLAYAVRYRRDVGLPVDGEWARAAKYVNDFQRHAISQQNRDASFSTKWLERREAREDSQRRIQTTGHILEWLVYSLPEEQLRSPEMIRTVTYLADLLWNERTTKWEIGPKGHALHALNLYDQRVFGARIGQGGPRMEWR